MIILKEQIEAYKMILDAPMNYGYDSPPWDLAFTASSTCIPKYKLYEQAKIIYPFITAKFIFYIIADERFKIGFTPNGVPGYYASAFTKFNLPNTPPYLISESISIIEREDIRRAIGKSTISEFWYRALKESIEGMLIYNT